MDWGRPTSSCRFKSKDGPRVLSLQENMAVDPTLTHLHELVFSNDYSQLQQRLSQVTDKTLIRQLHRGQSLLTLAVSLGHLECVKILIDNGCSALDRNGFGWSAYHESISYGNREIIKIMYKSKRQELANWLASKGKELLQQVNSDLQNVEFDMQWSFKSIIPFVSSLCPSDTYKVYKKGSNIRIDTTLVGYEQLNWIRGNISIIFKGDVKDPKLVILDHDTKVIQQVWPNDFTIADEQIEEDISIALNTPNVMFRLII